jgi:(1->4)-alpha-D-glucan 1-alpha-D-glucosylmutase
VTRSGVNERDRHYIEQAVSRAKRKNPALSATIFDFLENVLLLQYPEDFKEADEMEWLDFVMKFQQITGPVMAKGVEDTTFYGYNRFVSLNEVGGNPERFGTPLDTFHGQNIERTKFWPYAMISTSTHDTKRSEDIRARLNVISEIPNEWRHNLLRWSRINKKRKSVIDGQWVPDRDEEYLLYQTLIGVWPIHSVNEDGYEILKKRVKDYMLKAIREAKVNTSWISPNLVYEEGLLKFVDAILSSSHGNPFTRDLETFQKKISYFGMFNSLSQILLKMTCPGIPDLYQGTEIWDFSLVDPDNRRPVHFDVPRKMLKALKEKMVTYGPDLPGFARNLVQKWGDGSIKLYVIYKSLNYRKENRRLFTDGAYIPLMGDGDHKEHICAFARKEERKVLLVVIPRFLTHLMQMDEMPFGKNTWGDSRLVISPEISALRFSNLFTGETLGLVERDGKAVLPLDQIFANFPVAMLEAI